MNHSQITGILIIFGLAYFLGWVSLTRSYSDQTELVNQVQVERVLRQEVNNLKDKIRTAERLYDIQTGRLLEMTILAKREINEAIGDLYKSVEESANFVERIINRERRK